MVERGDGDGAAQGFAGREDLAGLPLGRDVAREDLAVVPQRLHGGEAQDVEGAAHFVSGFPQGQAGFGGDDPREFLVPRGEGGAGLLKDLGTFEARRRVPEPGGGGDGGVGVRPGGEGDRAHDGAIEGKMDLQGGGGGDGLSGDERGQVHFGSWRRSHGRMEAARVLGTKPMEVWIGWVHEQPALLSGARRRPPDGMSVSQQPDRTPSNWVRLSVSRSHMPW